MNSCSSDTLISFVVPVYNGIDTLAGCMDSLLSQGEEYPYDIILVDDGSTDGSGELIDHYAGQYEKVAAVHQSNAGHTTARLSGLRKTTGDYVLFVDCDDIAEPFLVKKLSEIILQHRPDIIMFAYHEMSGSGNKPVYLGVLDGLYEGSELDELNNRMLIMDKDGKSFPRSLWSKIIRRDLADTALRAIPPEVLTGEDMCASVDAFLRCSSLFVLNEPLYRYCVSRTAQWRSDPQAFRRCLSIVGYLYQYTENRPEEIREQVYRLTVQQVYSAALRVSRSGITKSEYYGGLRSITGNELVKRAIHKARFSDIKLRIKQTILRFRLYNLINLFDKAV